MRIRLTRAGIRLVALLAVVAFAAYNTHNNLIFLVLSVGIAAVVMAFLGGLVSIRALSLELGEAPEAYAGSPFVERLRLGNASRLLHAFGIAVEDGASRIGFLRKGGSTLCPVSRLLPRRGLHRRLPVRLATVFPFGLFSFERRIEASRDILVFPEVRPIDPAALAAPGRGGAGTGGRPGRGDEFFRLRDYERGDAVHHIHWRTTAKVGTLMVRELRDAQEDRLALTFDPALGASADHEEFERVVIATASIARYFADVGTSYRFFSEELDLPSRSGREHLSAVLAHLAIAAPAEAPASAWRARLEKARARSETVVVVTARAAGPSGVAGAVRLVTPDRVLRQRGAA